MFPREPLLGANHKQITGGLSPKLASLAAISVSAFRIICVSILICGAGILGLGAQTSSIEADTKTALANEWMKPDGVEHVLKALELLTSGSLDPFRLNLKVLTELKAGDPSKEDLYRAAMGIPDADGRPTVQGLPSFLDTLAKANTLGKMTPSQEHDLFNSTQEILDDIYKSEGGKVALVEIYDSFQKKYTYLALYQLLNAAWKEAGVDDLEKLRAAFATDADGLVKQVATKIAATKES